MSQRLFTLPTQLVTGALVTFRSMDLLTALVIICAETLVGKEPRTNVPLPVRVVYRISGNWPMDMTVPFPAMLTVIVPLAESTPVPLVALMTGLGGLPKLPMSISSVVAPAVPRVAPAAGRDDAGTRKCRLSSALSATLTWPAVVMPVGILISSLPAETTLDP